MKLRLVQYSPVWENISKNIGILKSLLDEEKDNGDVYIFPELTLTGFTMNSKQFDEEETTESFEFFSGAASAKNAHVFAGMIERADDKIYNTLCHFDPNGKVINRYRKIHPFSFAGEDKNYSAGDIPTITRIGNTKIGLSICYDLRFPELYRLYGKERVDMMVDIANWPDKRIRHWTHLLRSRAIENQCFMIGVNRVGDDPAHHYNGFSSVFDPMGDEIVAVKDDQKIISAEIEIEKSAEVRKKLPFLPDIKLI